MNVYGFVFDGENNDGDSINLHYEFKADNQEDARSAVVQEAMNVLDEYDGGHIDIFDDYGVFICDVEN